MEKFEPMAGQGRDTSRSRSTFTSKTFFAWSRRAPLQDVRAACRPRGYYSNASVSRIHASTDHDLYHIGYLDPKSVSHDMLCRICAVQIQPSKHVLDRADHKAPTRQHDLQVRQIILIRDLSALKNIDHIDHQYRTDPSEVC